MAESLAGVPVESDDPRDVDVVVVHADDVVTALAATAQGRETVLRVTPPFRRRQRARIHMPGENAGPTPDDAPTPEPGEGSPPEARRVHDRHAGGDAAPVSIPAAAFVDDAAPSFPRAPETEPTPAASSDYDVDEHFERHEDAVAAWRKIVPEHFRDTVTHELDDASLEFDVKYLGP